MSDLSALIQSHAGKPVTDSEFGLLLERMGAERDATARGTAVEHILGVIPVTPQQVVALARTATVRDSIGLQLVLKRFARDREFIAERERYAQRTEWQQAREWLSVLWPF